VVGKRGTPGNLGNLVDNNKHCLHCCSRRWTSLCATRTRRSVSIDQTGRLPQDLRKESSTAPGTRVCAGFSAGWRRAVSHEHVLYRRNETSPDCLTTRSTRLRLRNSCEGARFMIPPSNVAIVLRSFWKGMSRWISPPGENHGGSWRRQRTRGNNYPHAQPLLGNDGQSTVVSEVTPDASRIWLRIPRTTRTDCAV